MIPYIRPPAIDLGFTQIEPFGILTAAGLLVGTYIIARAAKLDGKDPNPVQDFVVWALVGGVIVGHLMHLFLYHPEEMAKGPLQPFKVWDGLSSTGGMIGGAIAVILYFKIRKIPVRDYMDPIALGITPGWGIARVGCFLVHDHPGVPTDFFLAVDFPASAFPGGPRHDLGLYDALLLFTISALLWTLRKKNVMRGAYLPLAVGLYGSVRFFFDFLRATDLRYVDARYFGLTPAQYVAIGFVLYGIVGVANWVRRRGDPQKSGTTTSRRQAVQQR